jgi:hypothetical protein
VLGVKRESYKLTTLSLSQKPSDLLRSEDDVFFNVFQKQKQTFLTPAPHATVVIRK